MLAHGAVDMSTTDGTFAPFVLATVLHLCLEFDPDNHGVEYVHKELHCDTLDQATRFISGYKPLFHPKRHFRDRMVLTGDSWRRLQMLVENMVIISQSQQKSDTEETIPASTTTTPSGSDAQQQASPSAQSTGKKREKDRFPALLNALTTEIADLALEWQKAVLAEYSKLGGRVSVLACLQDEAAQSLGDAKAEHQILALCSVKEVVKVDFLRSILLSVQQFIEEVRVFLLPC